MPQKAEDAAVRTYWTWLSGYRVDGGSDSENLEEQWRIAVWAHTIVT